MLFDLFSVHTFADSCFHLCTLMVVHAINLLSNLFLLRLWSAVMWMTWVILIYLLQLALLAHYFSKCIFSSLFQSFLDASMMHDLRNLHSPVFWLKQCFLLCLCGESIDYYGSRTGIETWRDFNKVSFGFYFWHVC